MAFKTKSTPSLQPQLLNIARLHFFYAAALAIQLIVFDAWQLLGPTAVLQRWVAASLFLAAITGIWYFAHSGRSTSLYSRLVLLLILADIGIASFGVYNQRGMASRAVMLFCIPIIVAGILKSRTAIFATALLCVAAYVTAAVSYFVLHFNEGYKIELYGEVGFYCALFILLASFLSVHSATRKS